MNQQQQASPATLDAPDGAPDAKGLAQRIAALRAWAHEQGYYSVPFWEQALRCLELVAAPALAFALLAQGGLTAVVGMLVLAMHYPRTAYLGHDVAHSQWGPRGEMKARLKLRLIALAQGFGSTWWVEKHELHHAFPNACRVEEDGSRTPIDGDIDSPPWLVWDKSLAPYNDKARRAGLGRALSFFLPRFQVPLFFPILSVARFNWSWQSIEVAAKNKQWWEASLCVAHWVSGFALAGLLTPGPAWTGWLWFLGAQLLGGFILAFVFVLNHTGMEVYDAKESKGFYDRQARATRNTPSSPLLDWLTGGLNSQIEHHMFPSLSRRRLTKMREATRAAMEECGYAYVTLSNREAMRAVLSTLGEAAWA
ncbi:fatty acid desaturase [Methylosinus sp. LW4]|uniref:fatty acid desaturase n=1 Tax=Methylosinus sp. LW4 TaxID=136993 RepID=UPI0012F868C3|nr:fatty acid desaturase [Methylosinus sp. LW4]